MTERYQSVNKINILAQALFDTEEPWEYHGQEMTKASVEWDVEACDIVCVLQRYSDSSGTTYALEVFRADEYYDDMLDDVNEIGLELCDDELDECEPIEAYEISYEEPCTIKKAVDLGNVFMNIHSTSDRVTWLLEQAEIAPDKLERRQSDNETFWRVVGFYALSDGGIEQQLIQLGLAGGGKAPADLVQNITKNNYGLTKKQIDDAIGGFYKSSHGQRLIKNSKPLM